MSVGSWKAATTTPLYLTTDALLLLGCTIPSLAAGRRWLLDSRARRRLHPLWTAVYRANPDIALFSRETRPELRLQLYRQVIEIRDGQLALRPFLDPRAAQISRRLGHEAGLPEPDIAAISEAATLAAAITAKIQGQPPHPPYPDPPTPRGGTDLATEIAWLQQVSRAFTNSPIVADTVRMLTDTTATDHPTEQLDGKIPP